MTTNPEDLPEPAHDDPAEDTARQTTEDPGGNPSASDGPVELDDEEETSG